MHGAFPLISLEISIVNNKSPEVYHIKRPQVKIIAACSRTLPGINDERTLNFPGHSLRRAGILLRKHLNFKNEPQTANNDP